MKTRFNSSTKRPPAASRMLLQELLSFTSLFTLFFFCCCCSFQGGYQAQAQIVQFNTSNLPIIAVTSFGIPLNRNFTIPCQLKIWYNPTKSIYSQYDPPDFIQDCGIKIRGHSSAMYDKKKFTVQIWSDLLAKNKTDFNLLGIGLGSEYSFGK